ncbi:hypothetical protein QU39_00120, partial [Staphylococcus aureus]
IGLARVIVIAALADEEGLAAMAQAASCIDHPGDAHQLARDVAGEHGAGRRVDEIAVERAVRRDDRVGSGRLVIAGIDVARACLRDVAQAGGRGKGGEGRVLGVVRRVAHGRIARTRERAGGRQHQRRTGLADHRQV